MANSDVAFIQVKNVRCNYPQPWLGQIGRDGKPMRPSVKLLLDDAVPSDKATLDAIKAQISMLCLENHDQAGAKEGKTKLIPPERRCLRRGEDTSRAEEDPFWVVSTSGNRERGIIVVDPYDPTKKVTDPLAEPKFYSGCRINARIRCWWQKAGKGEDGPYPTRVNCEIVSMQFAGNDEPLSAGHVSDEDAMEGFEAGTFDGGGQWGGGEESTAAAAAGGQPTVGDDDDF